MCRARILIGIFLIILVIGCNTEWRNHKSWCKGCGEHLVYSELRCNEYGIQFCVPCTKEYPNLFENILTVEDDHEDNRSDTEREVGSGKRL